MKKKICLFLICFIFLITLFSFNIHAESSKFFTISANPAENSNTSMNIVWHTEKDVLDSYLIYAKKSDTNWINKVQLNPTSTLNQAFAGKNAKYGTTSDDLKHPYEFTKNEVTITDLEPGTEYKYKITDGTNSSDVRYFKTGNQDFNFVWISDFHAYYASATRLKAATVAVNKCIEAANNKIDFIFSTGDIVAHGGTYQWWKQVSEASWMKNYMFSTTLGNHDWMTNVGTTYNDGASYKFMDACYNNPRNGFTGQENICYFYKYGDALFISVNTEIETAKYLGLTSEQFVKAQQDWVESVLQNNTAQYIFLFQHYQAFSTSGAYNSSGYNRWHDICDKYDIDIFFTGNSHVYMRSLPIYQGEISTDPSKGTIYMVAPSSDAERGVVYSEPTKNTDKIVKSWSDQKAQAASLVKVTSEGISLKLINYDGSVLDSVEILPKRLPTNYEDIDLSGFDKDKFEKSFSILVNQDKINNPMVNFSKNAHDVLRSIKVFNPITKQKYYEGMIFKDATSCILNMVEKGTVEISIELRYVDSSIQQLDFEIDNVYDWGYIENVKIEQIEDEYKLIWDEETNPERLNSINIMVDGFRYDIIASNVKEAILPADIGEHKVTIVVKDKDGDIVYESNELSYEIFQYYKVIFLDASGKEIKTEMVKAGEDAIEPQYDAPEGFKFVKWNNDYKNITKNTIIQAIIEKVQAPKPLPDDNAKSGCKKSATIMISLFLFSIFIYVFRKKR